MDLKLIEAQAKALAPVFQNILSVALADQRREMEESFNKKLDEIKNSIPDISGLSAEFAAFKKIEIPEVPDLSSMITESFESLNVAIEDRFKAHDATIQAAIESIPVPENGKDGQSVTLDDVKPIIKEMVDEIPKPQDGKSVTVEDIEPIIAEAVNKAVSEIPPAKDGKSVTVEDVLPLITEEISKKIAEIPAPKDGKDGIDGKSVELSDVLPVIQEEIVKQVSELPRPADGKDGAPGRDGIDGKDSMQIEIQPSVDFEKSYPRGTFAVHNGGVIRSYMQTSGDKGWDVLYNGIASFEYRQVDERTVELACKMTDGTEKTSLFHVPAVIDRGVFREENKYLQGDGVTFGGSFWIAQKDHPEGKPGQSQDWRLAVKKGRDAK